jgi:hypothetical protein
MELEEDAENEEEEEEEDFYDASDEDWVGHARR